MHDTRQEGPNQNKMHQTFIMSMDFTTISYSGINIFYKLLGMIEDENFNHLDCCKENSGVGTD